MTQKEREELWEKVMGYWQNPGGVESLFEAGSDCSHIWEKICACEQRIREYTGEHGGVSENELEKEFEKLFDGYSKICKLVSLRMFDYGVEYGKTGTPLI